MWRPLNCKAICVQLCNTHTVFTNAFSVKYWVMELKSCKRRKRNGKIKGNCNTICAKRSAKCIQIFLNHGTDGYSQDNSALDEVCILDKKVLTILVLRSWCSRNVSSVQHQSIVTDLWCFEWHFSIEGWMCRYWLSLRLFCQWRNKIWFQENCRRPNKCIAVPDKKSLSYTVD